MKFKLLICVILAVFTTKSVSQSKIEKDILGIWQLTYVDIEDFYEYNFESKEVKLAGFMTMGSEEDLQETKAGIIKNTKRSYFGFNDNNSYTAFQGDQPIKGTYEIEEDSDGIHLLTLKSDSKTEYLTFTISNTNPKQLLIVTDMLESTEGQMDSKLTLLFNLLSDKEIGSLRKDEGFLLFENEMKNSKTEKQKEEQHNYEIEMRNAKEDKEIAERLRNEETDSNKLYKSNIDIFKAADIIIEKFETNSIQDIIKNENIKTEYNTSNNLYKSTISIKDTELIYISDYDGEKYFNIIIDSDYNNEIDDSKSGYIKNVFYDYKSKIEEWLSENGGYSISEDWNVVIFEKEDSNVKMELRIRGIDDKHLVELSFHQ